MNNFKKIGLSALAGSLVLSLHTLLNFQYQVARQLLWTDQNKHLVTGNDFSMGDSLGFNMQAVKQTVVLVLLFIMKSMVVH